MRNAMAASPVSCAQASAPRTLSWSCSTTSSQRARSWPVRCGAACSTSSVNHIACRRRSSVASPRSTSRSAANSRIVSSIRKRTLVVLLDLPDEALVGKVAQPVEHVEVAPPESMDRRSPRPPRASKPPEKTEARAKRHRSGLVEEVVAPIDRAAQGLLPGGQVAEPPPPSSARRLSRRGSIACGLSSLTRAAASSMASGRPSSRAVMAATAGAFSLVTGEVRLGGHGTRDEERDRLVLRHRLERRQIGGVRARRAAAPGTPARRRRAAATRLVTTTRTSGPALQQVAEQAGRARDLLQVVEHQQDPARAPGTRRRARRCRSRPRARRARPRWPERPAPGPTTGSRGTKKTPSGKSSIDSAATCSASRVLPVPPGPVERQQPASWPAGVVPRRPPGRGRRSWSAATGRLLGRGVERTQGRELVRQARRARAGRCAPSARGP